MLSNSIDAKDLRVGIKFLGANCGVVTGSATLVTIMFGDVRRNILVDYGSFQGIDESLNDYRKVNPSEIDCILLTHSHLDHCGGVPEFFLETNEKYSFKGKIYASNETCNEAVHILKDSAKVNTLKSHVSKSIFSKTKKRLALEREKAIREEVSSKEIAQLDSDYSQIVEQEDDIPYGMDEAIEAIKHFRHIVFTSKENYEDVELFDGITARFIPTSHINGSCMIELTARANGESYSILFTGDIGKDETLLYKKMKYCTNSNVKAIVMESLHGASSSPERLCDSIDDFRKLISKNLKRNKTIIIPTFALDRTAGFIMLMNKFMDEGMHFDCYLDSPLGYEELEEYSLNYSSGVSAWFKDLGKAPFSLNRIGVPQNYAEHLALANSFLPSVIITSSGMGQGGRVLDYFEHHVQEEKSTFIFPGYLTVDSPSRILHETQKGYMCELNGNRYVKHCDTYWLGGFSSHGYYEDKYRILEAYPNIEHIFLNHGDDDDIRDLYYELKDKYPKAVISVPSYEDSVELF